MVTRKTRLLTSDKRDNYPFVGGGREETKVNYRVMFWLKVIHLFDMDIKLAKK